jgi:hypothetical protein
MTNERDVRKHALRMALTVRQYGGRVVLRERYGERKIIGSVRSWFSAKRAISRYARTMEAVPRMSGRKAKR